MRTAIVVGAGIGGLAAAAGLSNAGWAVTVFEQAPELRALGAGITLAPNAVRALDWLGLGEALRKYGMAQGPAGLRTSSGRWLLRSRVDELERRFGVPSFALHRSDLLRLLADGAASAEFRTGQRVTLVRNTTAGAEVTYEGADGLVSMTADLVVATDGVHSRLRGQLFPDHPGASYAGYVTWRAVVPPEAAPHPIENAVTETWGQDAHRFGVVPLSDGSVYWFAGTMVRRGVHLHDTLPEIAGRFAGWHPPIPELLTATSPEDLLAHDIFHLADPLPTYVNGRIALLGDAAHAMTPDLGQGAAQALEDAVTLAVLVSGHHDRDGVDVGLADYDRMRRPRTQKLVRASAQFGRIAGWRNPVAAAARNAVAGLIPASVYLNSTAETFSWQPPARV